MIADIGFGSVLPLAERHKVAEMTDSKKDIADLYGKKMPRELVLQKLREKGCRITKQRQMLLDVILQEECNSCKEIYYKVKKEDDRIGVATVYRMVNLLEEIGVINRKNMYKVSLESCLQERADEL